MVAFDSNNCFMFNRPKCLYVRQRIKRRYCKEKALKLLGNPTFYALPGLPIPCSPVCGITGGQGSKGGLYG
ncbi:hypothetical protein ES708_11963 [subsurface metagenome]